MISLIAAMSENRVIGRDGGLPWHLPADLKHFQQTTMGHPVIMGRRTFESLGRPLPGRTNIIVTRNPDYELDDAIVVRSLDEAIQAAEDDDPEEIFILGGEEIFRQALPRAQRMYLTLVQAEFDGDVMFPEFNAGEWRTVEQREHPADEKNKYACTFQTIERMT